MHYTHSIAQVLRSYHIGWAALAVDMNTVVNYHSLRSQLHVVGNKINIYLDGVSWSKMELSFCKQEGQLQIGILSALNLLGAGTIPLSSSMPLAGNYHFDHVLTAQQYNAHQLSSKHIVIHKN